MSRALAVLISAFTFATCPLPAFADSEMKQSPLMMRRAGPSCQAGDLGGDPGAGYAYRLGPCAGPEAARAEDATPAGRPVRRRGRRF